MHKFFDACSPDGLSEAYNSLSKPFSPLRSYFSKDRELIPGDFQVYVIILLFYVYNSGFVAFYALLNVDEENIEQSLASALL